jgi:hypothetical protein
MKYCSYLEKEKKKKIQEKFSKIGKPTPKDETDKATNTRVQPTEKANPEKLQKPLNNAMKLA